MNAIKQVFRRLLFGGSKKLRPYERAVADSVVDALADDIAVIAREQLRAFDFVQRAAHDRVVTFYFSEPIARFARTDTHVLGSALLRAASGSARAQLIAHGGRLSSLEFTSPPFSLVKADFSVGSAIAEGSDLGTTSKLDAEEHSG
ncbi:MAG: hypothetical protein M3P06_14530 [Acidobacteriota bacterium]|nr:hypothetical protein [Acidobacteriota bacterium]